MISHSPDQIPSVSFLTPLRSFYIAIILNHSLLAQLLIQLQPFFCFCPSFTFATACLPPQTHRLLFLSLLSTPTSPILFLSPFPTPSFQCALFPDAAPAMYPCSPQILSPSSASTRFLLPCHSISFSPDSKRGSSETTETVSLLAAGVWAGRAAGGEQPCARSDQTLGLQGSNICSAVGCCS